MLKCWLVIDAADLAMTDEEWWIYLQDWLHFSVTENFWDRSYN